MADSMARADLINKIWRLEEALRKRSKTLDDIAGRAAQGAHNVLNETKRLCEKTVVDKKALIQLFLQYQLETQAMTAKTVEEFKMLEVVLDLVIGSVKGRRNHRSVVYREVTHGKSLVSFTEAHFSAPKRSSRPDTDPALSHPR